MAEGKDEYKRYNNEKWTIQIQGNEAKFLLGQQFNGADSCRLYSVSDRDEWTSMEHWWKDFDSSKRQYLEINLSHCQFVQQKFDMDRQGIEPISVC
jgi:hypothetical protein